MLLFFHPHVFFLEIRLHVEEGEETIVRCIKADNSTDDQQARTLQSHPCQRNRRPQS